MAVTNRYHIGLLFVLICSLSVRGHRVKLGGYAGVLDRMGAGIAELGAGNTGTARRDAIPAAYWNPALLAFQRKTVVATGADVRSLNRNGGTVGIQGRIAPNMGLGLGIVNRGDYKVEVYDGDEHFLGTARPQDIGFYLGVGMKTSRKNSYGVALQWYYSNKDIGGQGDINTIGIFNFGWYRTWTRKLKTGLVLRNLGINDSLSAKFNVRTGLAESDFDMDRSGEDFIPKTLAAAAAYQFTIVGKPLDVYLEFLDFLLYDRVFDEKVYDRDHHAVDFRLGADWQYSSNFTVRTGYDRGNLNFGFGYRWKTGKGKALTFDYAVVLERAGITINPCAFGLRYEL